MGGLGVFAPRIAEVVVGNTADATRIILRLLCVPVPEAESEKD